MNNILSPTVIVGGYFTTVIVGGKFLSESEIGKFVTNRERWKKEKKMVETRAKTALI